MGIDIAVRIAELEKRKAQLLRDRDPYRPISAELNAELDRLEEEVEELALMAAAQERTS